MTASLQAIGVVVDDLERSVALYRRLGLAFPDEVDPEGHGHVEAELPGGLRVMFDTVETIQSFDPEWRAPSGSPRAALAFECGSPDEVDATYRELVEAGCASHKEPWDAFWGMRYAQLRDPDGNAIDLFASLR
jgi:uncharacterized glyoxalase superfamily protein PhnB